MATEQGAADRELVLTRVFDAPRELVWRAWTDPQMLVRWWGPEGFTSPVCKLDLRVGGKYLFCMRSPDGKDFWSTGVYKEIDPPARLVCTDSFADEHGNVVSAAQYGLGDDFPDEMLITVTLDEEGGKTRMTVRQAGMPGGKMREMATAGWNGQLDKLAALVEGAAR